MIDHSNEMALQQIEGNKLQRALEEWKKKYTQLEKENFDLKNKIASYIGLEDHAHMMDRDNLRLNEHYK